MRDRLPSLSPGRLPSATNLGGRLQQKPGNAFIQTECTLRNFIFVDLPLHFASTTGIRDGVWKIKRENLSLPVKVFHQFIIKITAAYSLEDHLIGFSKLHPLF